MPAIKVVRSVRSGHLIVLFPFLVSRSDSVKSSKVRISIGFELGRRLYFAIFLGLYPTIVGGDSGGIGGFSMGGGRRIYGLSPTSVVRFEKSGDGGALSSVVSGFLSSICCVAVSSCVFATSCVTGC